MQERRKITCRRVLKGVKFLLKNSSVMGCIVRDLSNTGAVIAVPNTIDLPEASDLTFHGGRKSRPCRLVWREINKAGVEFV